MDLYLLLFTATKETCGKAAVCEEDEHAKWWSFSVAGRGASDSPAIVDPEAEGVHSTVPPLKKEHHG
jgi:hypothetical protein